MDGVFGVLSVSRQILRFMVCVFSWACIQANQRLTFEDNLRSGGLLYFTMFGQSHNNQLHFSRC